MESLATLFIFGPAGGFGPVLFGLEMWEVISQLGHFVYALLTYIGVMGIYYTVLLFRRIQQKRFASVDASREFLGTIRELMRTEKYDEAIKMCETPAYWRIAVPQLVTYAIKNRKESLARLKRDLVIKFEGDVIGSLDRYLSYIFTYTRMGPLAGLLGTVMSMIAAFSHLGAAGKTRVDPGELATDISLALWATAFGLLVATPLTLVGNMINVRIRQLEGDSQETLQRFMEDFERSPAARRPAAARA